MVSGVLSLSTEKVGELLDEKIIDQLATMFAEKVTLEGLPVGTFNRYQVRCKDGEYRRFITIYGEEGMTTEVYVMTVEDALAMPKTGEAVRKRFPDLVA